MRILVIEDDASVLDYISRGLRESGFTVDQAADGKDGLFRASAEKYDALVVDRMLPGVDGLDHGPHAARGRQQHAGADPERARARSTTA